MHAAEVRQPGHHEVLHLLEREPVDSVHGEVLPDRTLHIRVVAQPGPGRRDKLGRQAGGVWGDAFLELQLVPEEESRVVDEAQAHVEATCNHLRLLAVQVLQLNDALALLPSLLLGLTLAPASGPENDVDERLVHEEVFALSRLLRPPALLLQLPHSIRDALLGLRVEAEE